MTLFKGALVHMIDKDGKLIECGHVLYEVKEYSYISNQEEVMVILRIIK